LRVLVRITIFFPHFSALVRFWSPMASSVSGAAGQFSASTLAFAGPRAVPSSDTTAAACDLAVSRACSNAGDETWAMGSGKLAPATFAIATVAAAWNRSRRSGAKGARPQRVVRQAKKAVVDAPDVVKPTFDFSYWAENVEETQKNAENRAFKCDVAATVKLYEQYREVMQQVKEVQIKRNENSAKMKNKLEPAERDKIQLKGKDIKAELTKLEGDAVKIEVEMNQLALSIPNRTHESTPIGDEENATVVKIVGEPLTPEAAGFKIKDHLEIGESLGFFDFESGGKVSGQKFLYYKNEAALLELALVTWATHEAVKRGFTPVLPPDLIRNTIVAGCGFNPRDGEATQIYEVKDTDLCLAGTAEIPIAGMFMNETLIASEQLPQKLVAFGHAFRTEAGSSGSESRGIYRLHQFSKVELFGVTRGGDFEESDKLLEEISDLEEHLYTSLGLCYRVLDMPTEELGAPAYRKFDMEAWMPGLQKWGEISSCSSCSDFQARRLNIRHKETYTQKGGLQFVHTLNGTACAVPRMIISILETFQQEDGSVIVPEVLRPYMMGIEKLEPKTKGK